MSDEALHCTHIYLYFIVFFFHFLPFSLSNILSSSSSSLRVCLWIFFSRGGWTWPCRTCERQLRDSDEGDATPPSAQLATQYATLRATMTRWATNSRFSSSTFSSVTGVEPITNFSMYFTISLVLLGLLRQLHRDLDPWPVRKPLEALERTHRARERERQRKRKREQRKSPKISVQNAWVSVGQKFFRGVELDSWGRVERFLTKKKEKRRRIKLIILIKYI